MVEWGSGVAPSPEGSDPRRFPTSTEKRKLMRERDRQAVIKELMRRVEHPERDKRPNEDPWQRCVRYFNDLSMLRMALLVGRGSVRFRFHPTSGTPK